MNDETSSDSMVLAPVAADLSRVSTAREADRFGYCLLLAAALHAMAFVGFKASGPSRLGAPGGAEQAISVSLITSADLESRSTVDDAAAGQPAPKAPPGEQTPPAPPAAIAPPDTAQPVDDPPVSDPINPPVEPVVDQSEAEARTEPADARPEPETAPAEKAQSEAEEVAKSQPSEGQDAIPALRKSISDVPAEAVADKKEPAEKPEDAKDASDEAKSAEAKPAERSEAEAKSEVEAKKADEPKKAPSAKPKPQRNAERRTANLAAPSPPVMFSAPQGGGGAGVQRPPGITRSGANDEFARGVIRALQRTMPHLRDSTGRVTVRIKLDKNGNLASTTVVRPSRVSGMDQSVVFATHQSSFPLPPLNANTADLTFIVTYIYR